MLDDYLAYLESHPNSLLARIYGVYTIRTSVFGAISVIIVQNTCQTNHRKNPRMVFDLKGSSFSRKVNVEDKFWRYQLHQAKVMKDNNFKEINYDISLFTLTKAQTARVN